VSCPASAGRVGPHQPKGEVPEAACESTVPGRPWPGTVLHPDARAERSRALATAAGGPGLTGQQANRRDPPVGSAAMSLLGTRVPRREDLDLLTGDAPLVEDMHVDMPCPPRGVWSAIAKARAAAAS